jgi:hypothetical protein
MVAGVSGVRVRRGFRAPFTMIPAALLDRPTSGVSDRAVRLWGLLDRYADTERNAWPSRRTLAATLGCSPDSLDRAIRDLEQSGWLHVERRVGREGSRNEPSLYTLLDATPPSRTGAASPSRNGAATLAAPVRPALERESKNENPPSPPVGGNVPVKVGRKIVTAEEGAAALCILGEFNAQAGTSYTAAEHLRAIIARMREHPEHADCAAQARLIRANLADPWWKGAPGPQVIYGNGGVYEQAVERAKRAKATSPSVMLSDEERAERRAAAEVREREQVAAALDDWYAANPDVPDPRKVTR